MLRGFTKGQVIGFVLIVILGIIIIFASFKFVNHLNEPVEVVQNTNILDDDFTLNINGDYVTYIELNEKYEDLGAKAYLNGVDISNDIITTYYLNGTQVSTVDTKKASTYIVRYDVRKNDKIKTVTRVVIITDEKEPSITVPDTVTITSDEALSYDVSNGVIVTDNTGDVSFSCDNTLSNVPGDYVIKCTARDRNGNESSRNRLIKVTEGISFKYDDKLTINYPSGNYTYKYSLDNGNTWNEASSSESLDVSSGNVIALVLENNNYKMSSTYYVG